MLFINRKINSISCFFLFAMITALNCNVVLKQNNDLTHIFKVTESGTVSKSNFKFEPERVRLVFKSDPQASVVCKLILKYKLDEPISLVKKNQQKHQKMVVSGDYYLFAKSSIVFNELPLYSNESNECDSLKDAETKGLQSIVDRMSEFDDFVNSFVHTSIFPMKLKFIELQIGDFTARDIRKLFQSDLDQLKEALAQSLIFKDFLFDKAVYKQLKDKFFESIQTAITSIETDMSEFCEMHTETPGNSPRR